MPCAGLRPYTDLYLPIDALEKKLFDTIDGQRTIGEIAREHGQLEAAHAFFQQVWWYDQVVFDASRLPAQEPDAWVGANLLERAGSLSTETTEGE